VKRPQVMYPVIREANSISFLHCQIVTHLLLNIII
jgi:hypothetical protein